MNTAIQCIILLTCATICHTAIIRTNCQCIKTTKYVDRFGIADIKKYHPRPYCSKEEIIVTLKNGSSQCLDPNEKYIQAVVKTWQIQTERAAKMSSTSPKTTMTLATAAPTLM